MVEEWNGIDDAKYKKVKGTAITCGTQSQTVLSSNHSYMINACRQINIRVCMLRYKLLNIHSKVLLIVH